MCDHVGVCVCVCVCVCVFVCLCGCVCVTNCGGRLKRMRSGKKKEGKERREGGRKGEGVPNASTCMQSSLAAGHSEFVMFHDILVLL